MQADFDVTIFGATGFTGRLAAIYLCRHYPQLRIAIAGRNRDKLLQVAQQCSKLPEIVIADSANPQTVQAMVKRTQVVANFAGPFSLYGANVVAACAQNGRHYCDITGETPWVRTMIDQHQSVALATGACLIPFAGFDSVPADLLTYLALVEAKQQGLLLDEIVHNYQIRGGLNGGTLASALTIAEQGLGRDLLNVNILLPDQQWSGQRNKSIAPVQYEEVIDRWTAPFFMNPINRAVVRRSAFLREGTELATGPFDYEERMVTGSGIFGRLQAQLTTLALLSFTGLTNTKLGRSIFGKLGPQPGDGPSELQRAGSFYKGQLIGKVQGKPRVMVTADCQGDPGNEVTVTFAAEIAKLLSENAQGGHCRGFVTPSVAFGESLAERLKAAGVGFKVQSLPAT